MKKHHTYVGQRCDLWIARVTDRDRTTERVELGDRVFWAIRAENKSLTSNHKG